MKKRVIFLAGVMSMLMSTAAYAADWPQFLGQPDRQGLSDGAAAVQAGDLALRWEKNTGSSWVDVPGTPIVVGDKVYYYSSERLRMLDLATGKELKSVAVYGEPVNQFFINIAYADGKIFVPCQIDNMSEPAVKGCFFRVFDAESLEQLYVTELLSKGQMQSPVMCHDGYFVTGTYGRDGVYAAFTAEDEDKSRGDEVKQAEWTVKCEGKYGFGFNGAAFVGDYCYFGYANNLYVVNYATGEVKNFDFGEGYVTHSTITYSEETKRLYIAATHPDGCAAVKSYRLSADGLPMADTVKEWVSGTEFGGTQSSPVIYNGRLYLGGGGGTMGSAEPFHVIDAVTMKEIYSVPILSKGSAAVTTAYATDANDNQVYVYMVPYAPVNNESQLWIISDKEGQTQADYEVISGVGAGQYCSQSVIIAGDGALLWYNDGGRLYCYENTADEKVNEPADQPEVDKQPENTAVSFKDTEKHWAKDSIALLAEKKILSGTAEGVFSPEAAVTRAQFAQVLAKLSGEDFGACKTTAFADVKDGDWFAPAVAWAVEKGVAKGNTADTFAPNAKITRQDMAVMLQRYVENVAKVELPAKNAPLKFIDEAKIAGYAKDAVSTMQTAGIIGGIAEGDGYCFEPAAQATRAQAATMAAGLYKILNK